jgi:hypothetical protein
MAGLDPVIARPGLLMAREITSGRIETSALSATPKMSSRI